MDRGEGIPTDSQGTCPLGFYQRLLNEQADLTDNITRDFYALVHYLLTDVTATTVGETTSVSGVPLPDDITTDSFFTVTPTEADDPPQDDMPPVVLDGEVFRDVSPNTNLNYVVTIDSDAVPTAPDEPLLYRVQLRYDTEYRAGSVVQELWVISPPAQN